MTQTRTFRTAVLFAILAFAVTLVIAPVTITFAYSYSGYQQMNYYQPQQTYQLYWCNGYYSYSPCPVYQQPTFYYYYPQPYYYYSSSYYDSYAYSSSYNYSYNYGYNGGWYY